MAAEGAEGSGRLGGPCDGPEPAPGCAGVVTPTVVPVAPLAPGSRIVTTVEAPRPVSMLWTAVRTVSIAASVYHGTRRNDSIGWGITWGVLAAVAPVITPAVALAQGFGRRK